MNSNLRLDYAKISREVDSGIYEEVIDDFEEDRNFIYSEERLPPSPKPTHQVVPPRLFRKDSIRNICNSTTLRHEEILRNLLNSEELHLKVLIEIKCIRQINKLHYNEDLLNSVFGQLDGLIDFHGNFFNGLEECKTLNDLGGLLLKMESQFKIFIEDKWIKSKSTTELPYIFVPYSDWSGGRLKIYNDLVQHLNVNRAPRLKRAVKLISNILKQYDAIDFLKQVKNFPKFQCTGDFILKSSFQLAINEVDHGLCTVILMEHFLLLILPLSQECFAEISTKFTRVLKSEVEGVLVVKDSSNNLEISLKSEASVEITLWVIALKQLEEITEINEEKNGSVSANSLLDSKHEEQNIKKSKSQYIIDELLKTEKDFLENMRFVENNYILNLSKESNNHEEKEALKMVFLNWDQLQIQSTKFILEIEKCGYDCELIGELFLDCSDLIREFCFYLTNQPVANTYMAIDGDLYLQAKKIQADIGDPLGLSNHLLIPMQRLTKYPLILQSLLSSLEDQKSYQKLRAAIDMLKTVTEESNSFIAASSIANLPFTLKDQGKFIRKDTFDGIEGRQHLLWKSVEVFLFENVIIFAAIQPHNNYMYKESIYFEHMTVQINQDLILVDFMRNKLYNSDKYTFILKSKDLVMVSKWRKIIENQLWLQMISIKEKCSEIGSALHLKH